MRKGGLGLGFQFEPLESQGHSASLRGTTGYMYYLPKGVVRTWSDLGCLARTSYDDQPA
jgi:hypothetical protein